MTQAMRPDVIDAILGIAPDSSLAQVRGQRPDVVLHTQRSYDALFDPASPGGLSQGERLAAALRIALLAADASLASHYRKRLTEARCDPGLLAGAEQAAGAAGNPRWIALLRHAEMVTEQPRMVMVPHIETLKAAGLSERDIVTLSQLIAFVNYQARVVAGLRLIRGA